MLKSKIQWLLFWISWLPWFPEIWTETKKALRFLLHPFPTQTDETSNKRQNPLSVSKIMEWQISKTRSLGALRAPTSSWRPFGPLDFALRVLRPVRRARLMSGPVKIEHVLENVAFFWKWGIFLEWSIFLKMGHFFNMLHFLKIRHFLIIIIFFL